MKKSKQQKQLEKELKKMSAKQLENLRKIFITDKEQDEATLKVIEEIIARKTILKNLL